MAVEAETAPRETPKALRSPLSVAEVHRERHSLKRELFQQPILHSIRISILGGSATTEGKSVLELMLPAQGIKPLFYESGYHPYYEDVFIENPDLWNLKPDIV